MAVQVKSFTLVTRYAGRYAKSVADAATLGVRWPGEHVTFSWNRVLGTK